MKMAKILCVPLCMKQAIVQVVIVVSLLVITNNADGYELRRIASNRHVRWHSTQIRMVLDSSLERIGPIDKVERAIIESFETWRTKTDLPIDFYFVRSNCAKAGYVSGKDNSNCLMASTSKKMWASHTGDRGAIAVVTYSPVDGEIIDGDIVYNAADWDWNLDANEKGTLSFRSVTTHEIGHLMGLAHSSVVEATMFPETCLGEDIKQTLHDDDTNAVHSLYAGFDEEIQVALGNTDRGNMSDYDIKLMVAEGNPSSWLFFGVFLIVLSIMRGASIPILSRSIQTTHYLLLCCPSCKRQLSRNP